ncbi:MAG: acetylglutamate kinase [Saprospiraceae bacterium]
MTNIIKIGGKIIDQPDALQAFLRLLASIDGPKILIHGGGKLATHLADKLQIPQQIIDGRRITDRETLDVITMVYAGLVNKSIVASLSGYGCTSIGLCGADANLILAQKRPIKDIDYGFVGDIISVQGNIISEWLTQGLTPVIAPITHDGKGQLLNTNADTMASAVAIAMSLYDEVRLVYCFEKSGVLLDVSDELSVIPQLNETKISELKSQGLIHSGMLPKLDNAVQTVKSGVKSVVIGKAEALKDLMTGASGTNISL